MKAITYFEVIILLLCIGTTTNFGQSKIVHKETDNRNNVSFVKFATDTIIPIKDAANLLKKLQPQDKDTDYWELLKM
ncbi:MAG: hypothetical protein LBP63_05880 [Prevotellaceae bacterium]|jgi:hypothetical protein|nr:hypothetical protein [Prevotellaceae bacterium]